MPSLLIPGPVGELEARHHSAGDPAAPLALVLHPNPKFGGNMNSMVVYTLFTGFQDAGFHVLRVNFRGVGRSAGEFSDGPGELADARAAWRWLVEQHPQAAARWVGGFSFGAWIGMQLIHETGPANGLIAVAPPVNRLDFSFVQEWTVPGLVMHGTEDQLVPVEAVREFVSRTSTSNDSKLELVTMDGASHFFENKEAELEAAVKGWIQQHL